MRSVYCGPTGPLNAPDPLNVTIDTQQTSDSVSKYVFGSFIEHIGTLIYRTCGRNCSMIENFIFRLHRQTRSATPAKRESNRQQLHKWRPVGPDNVVVMDIDEPFVGEHSPKILLDGATPHGISQRGFSLVGGKEYTGRIFLAALPGLR